MESNDQIARLLWTGGWDSTFRLLQLVLIDRAPVQPYYLIDTDRKSTGVELYTMRNIRRYLHEQHPHTRELIRPTIFHDVYDVPENAYITGQWAFLNTQYHLGTQHDWITRYVESLDLRDVEIAMEIPGYPVEPLLPMMIEDAGNSASSRLDPKYEGTPEYAIWGRFRFPIIHYTKMDMERIAREAGFLNVMEMSWFCHNPQPNFQPCGVCFPCWVVMRRMPHRMPLQGRLRYYRNIVKKQIKTPLVMVGSIPGRLRELARKNRMVYGFAKQFRRNNPTV